MGIWFFKTTRSPAREASISRLVGASTQVPLSTASRTWAYCFMFSGRVQATFPTHSDFGIGPRIRFSISEKTKKQMVVKMVLVAGKTMKLPHLGPIKAFSGAQGKTRFKVPKRPPAIMAKKAAH